MGRDGHGLLRCPKLSNGVARSIFRRNGNTIVSSRDVSSSCKRRSIYGRYNQLTRRSSYGLRSHVGTLTTRPAPHLEHTLRAARTPTICSCTTSIIMSINYSLGRPNIRKQKQHNITTYTVVISAHYKAVRSGNCAHLHPLKKALISRPIARQPSGLETLRINRSRLVNPRASCTGRESQHKALYGPGSWSHHSARSSRTLQTCSLQLRGTIRRSHWLGNGRRRCRRRRRRKRTRRRVTTTK